MKTATFYTCKILPYLLYLWPVNIRRGPPGDPYMFLLSVTICDENPPHQTGTWAVWAASETLYHRDDALLYIVYVMIIGAAPIPADRWHCSLWP